MTDTLMLILLVFIVFCPPKYDPAIQWKASGYNWKRFVDYYRDLWGGL